MKQALRRQGSLFCITALVLIVANPMLGQRNVQVELLAVGALLLLLGMPHGAFDVLIMRKLLGTAAWTPWTLGLLGYVGLSAAVVGVWMAAPTLFLCAFLISSALHFGGDREADTAWWSRLLYGGAVIVLPGLWHGEELQRLLGHVAGPVAAAWVAPVLSQLAIPWLVGTALVVVFQSRRSRLPALELAALVAISLAMPPLLAFCVYFCVMHSPRHIIRTLANLSAAEVRKAWLFALWPSLVVVLLAVASVVSMAALPSKFDLETGVMQLVFVGLAALTLPHMLLLAVSGRANVTGTSP